MAEEKTQQVKVLEEVQEKLQREVPNNYAWAVVICEKNVPAAHLLMASNVPKGMLGKFFEVVSNGFEVADKEPVGGVH